MPFSSLAYDTTAKQKKAATMIKDRIIDMVTVKASKSDRKTGVGIADLDFLGIIENKGDRERWTLADDINQLFLEFKLDKFRPERRNITPNAYLCVFLPLCVLDQFEYI